MMMIIIHLIPRMTSINNANWYELKGYKCYYFGDGDDGAMRTNKNTIEIDGDKFNFFFEKSGC